MGTLSVTVTATNEKKLSIGDTFDIVVANLNDPPKAADHIPDQSTKEDAAFSFVVPAGSFSDPDSPYGDVLTLSATRQDGTALPAWISLDPATGTFAGTPGDADVGKLAVRLTATDTAGASAASDFTVSVANVNDPPQLATPVADQSATQGKAFSLVLPSGTFSDPDLDSGDHLTLAASLADGSPLPAWLRFDAGRATFAGTPANADVGDLSIILTGTDTAGASAATTFALRVANVNDPPVVAQGIPDQATDEDSPFTLVVPADAFADPDSPYGDTLAFSATQRRRHALPAWLVLDPASGTLSRHAARGRRGQPRGQGHRQRPRRCQRRRRLQHQGGARRSRTHRSPSPSPRRPPRRAPPSASRCRRRPSPTSTPGTPWSTTPRSMTAHRCRHGCTSTATTGASRARPPTPTWAPSR